MALCRFSSIISVTLGPYSKSKSESMSLSSSLEGMTKLVCALSRIRTSEKRLKYYAKQVLLNKIQMAHFKTYHVLFLTDIQPSGFFRQFRQITILQIKKHKIYNYRGYLWIFGHDQCGQIGQFF